MRYRASTLAGKWAYFVTIEAAKAYAHRVFTDTGIVVSVETVIDREPPWHGLGTVTPAFTPERAIAVDKSAAEYNDRVWSSDEIKRARAHIRQAQTELGDDSKGWGTIPLTAARDQLTLAVKEIQTMLDWNEDQVKL